VIHKSVLVACDPARAFQLLTEEAGAWWPLECRHTKDPRSVIRIEATGRFYERSADGHEVELGVVRVFEPPERLVLDWYPGTGPSQPTLVEIILRAEGGATRVLLTHREGTHGAEEYARKSSAYARSWTLVLDALSSAASA
jgi:uncharacterized protein YndB with AHSA1/START domain